MADQLTTRQTNSFQLQQALDSFVSYLERIEAVSQSSTARAPAVVEFCRIFVPVDCEQEDFDYFVQNLITDEEYFQSLSRDIKQCRSGMNVEKIEGDQITRAVFTLLPLDGVLDEDCTLDIVREVAFICTDGKNWTAEG